MRDFRRLFVGVRDNAKDYFSYERKILMKWLLMVLLIVVSPAITAYSGTFRDDFNDGNADGWLISGLPPRFPHLVKFEDGYLVMDTVIGENELPEDPFKFVSLELRTGDAENWDSYTLTCRIRFAEVRGGPGSGFFNIDVRSSMGRFELVADKKCKFCCSLRA